MEILRITKDTTSVMLNYDEVFMLLQCVMEAIDTLSPAEIKIIMKVDASFLDKFADKLMYIKDNMGDLYENSNKESL